MILEKSGKIFFEIIYCLLVFVSLSHAWDVTSPNDVSKQCVEIFFQPSFQGPSIQLKDDEQISDLTDIQRYYGREKTHQTQTEGEQQQENEVEEEATSESDFVSFRLQDKCNLKLSAKTFLKDDVHIFTEDTDRMNLFVPKSASCECPKVCKCADNQLRKSECARAYLNDDCVNCKALFTTMKPNGEWNQFPQMWSSLVNSIILREGCDVSLRYAPTGNEIKSLSSRSNRIVKDVQAWGNITQYRCQCSEASSTKRNIIKTDPSYPQLVNIPKSKGRINTLLFSEELKTHPGLMAALQSLRNKRSSKNAYILLLGMTGSGKSSAVNLLFDHPNITKVGDFMSTTSDILEFSIPVPVPELGMNNTALHVIDTPGIGDTRGIAEDARFLGSLEDYLNRHEDLRRNLPNVVLIFSKFSDNRYRGNGAGFVKMLRTLDLFKDKIIDKKSTNVIFVLTHYMSETKDIIRDPTERIKSIRQVIHEFSTLPRPIHIVLAENKPEESFLPSINGFYRLPNGEFYPKNLFDQMQRNLIGDPVGEAIIRSAFSNSDNFQITGKRYRLLHQSNSKVTKYLGTLASFNTPVSGTEVSTELNKAYERLNSDIKIRYSDSDALNVLQRTLYNRNIIQRSDLPQTKVDVLKLFENIHINPVTLFLLEDAFNITIPEFKRDYVVGSGYSLISDTTLPAKIFQTTTTPNQPSELIFTFSDAYSVKLLNQLDNQIQVFATREDFISGRMKALGLSDDAIPVSSYTSSTSDHPGFNLISLSDEDSTDATPTWNSLTATLDYHTFQIELSNEAKFTEGFVTLLGRLETLNLTDSVNVQNWKDFFNRYGTHVVTSGFGGGSIKVTVELNTENLSSPEKTNTEKFAILSDTMANIVQELANELIGKDAIYSPPSEVNYQFYQRGGNHRYYWSNFSDLDGIQNVDDWKDSLKYEPIVLTSRLQLMPISKVVQELQDNPDLGYMIEEAAGALLNTSLIYLPIEKSENEEDRFESRDKLQSGRSSGDFKSVTEFANMFKMVSQQNKEMQQELLRAMSESREKQEQQEVKWQQDLLALKQKQAEDERKQLEEDHYNKELQLRREEMEMNRISQENALKAEMESKRMQADMQYRLMMEEIRYRNEQTMMTFINAENDRRAHVAVNKKGWLDKTLGFLQGGVESTSPLMSALPFLLAG